MSKRKSPPARYWKFQSKFVWMPAAIEAHRGDCVVSISVHPSRRASDREVGASTILLDPHEAIGFAAWVHEQAEHVLAKQARAAARRAARATKS